MPEPLPLEGLAALGEAQADGGANRVVFIEKAEIGMGGHAGFSFTALRQKPMSSSATPSGSGEVEVEEIGALSWQNGEAPSRVRALESRSREAASSARHGREPGVAGADRPQATAACRLGGVVKIRN